MLLKNKNKKKYILYSDKTLLSLRYLLQNKKKVIINGIVNGQVKKYLEYRLTPPIRFRCTEIGHTGTQSVAVNCRYDLSVQST